MGSRKVADDSVETMRRPKHLPISLQTVLDRWTEHELGRNRALGGRRALDGFRFQIYLSLEAFFRAVLGGDASAQFVFDGLSDLANTSGDLIYLTQAKVTLDTAAIKDAINEALVVDEFLEAEYPELREEFRFRFMGRRAKSRLDENLAELDAAHVGVDAQRWADLRPRILSVEINSSPRVGLAIQLWQHTRNPFRLSLLGFQSRAGKSTLYYVGETSGQYQGSGDGRTESEGSPSHGGLTPIVQESAPILPARQLTFTLSTGGNLGIAATPGFQGYLLIRCGFPNARGVAFVSRQGEQPEPGASISVEIIEPQNAVMEFAASRRKAQVLPGVSHVR